MHAHSVHCTWLQCASCYSVTATPRGYVINIVQDCSVHHATLWRHTKGLRSSKSAVRDVQLSQQYCAMCYCHCERNIWDSTVQCAMYCSVQCATVCHCERNIWDWELNYHSRLQLWARGGMSSFVSFCFAAAIIIIIVIVILFVITSTSFYVKLCLSCFPPQSSSSLFPHRQTKIQHQYCLRMLAYLLAHVPAMRDCHCNASSLSSLHQHQYYINVLTLLQRCQWGGSGTRWLFHPGPR